MCDLLKAREEHNDSLQKQSLRDIKDAISKEATRFSGYQQNDAHEFLCQVLDQLKDDYIKICKKLSENNNDKENEKQEINIEFLNFQNNQQHIFGKNNPSSIRL